MLHAVLEEAPHSDTTWFQLNPHNLNLSPGGSSGGEAALLALKGSCMGIGRQVSELYISPLAFISANSDVGGSIRGPSAFVGLYGIRPTSSTFPFEPDLW